MAALRSHAGAKVFIQLVSWIGTVYVLRRLDSDALGVFAIATVAFGYASMVYEGGMLEALVQHDPASPGERRSVFTLLAGSGLLLAGIVAGAAPGFARLMEVAQVEPILMTMALGLFITALGILPHAQLIREMRFGRLALISSAQAVASSGVSVALAYAGAGAWALALGLIAGLLVRTTLLNVCVTSLFMPTLRIAPALHYLRFGGILIADGLLWRWYNSLDTLLLGRWSGPASLGHYSFAQQLANMPLEKISTVVNDVSLPAYAELAQRRPEAARLMIETIRTHAVVGLPIFWGIAAVADVAIPLIFGAQWQPAIFALTAIALVAPLRLMGSVETPAMTGIGAPWILVKTKLLIVPAMTVAIVAGCWWGGVNGAALAWLCAFPFFYVIAFRWVLRPMALTYADVVGVVRGPALAAGLMMCIVRLGAEGMSRLESGPLPSLVAMIAAGAAAYLLMLRSFDREAYGLLINRARQLLLPARAG